MIAQVPSSRLIASLKAHEGCRLMAYQDTRGVWTCGWGATGPSVHEGTVWTQAQADAVLQVRAQSAATGVAKALPWSLSLSEPRFDVLAEMGYNLGLNGLLEFHNTLQHVERGEWQAAHDGMLASTWAKQVGQRAVTLADQMLSGEYP